MSEKPRDADLHKAAFLQLVVMFSTSAMQHLGKIINPLTGKTEINLPAAQATIDMLEMLKAKTAGNLDLEEERTLNSTLAMLQLNYVETAQPAPAAAGPAAPTGDQQARAAETAPTDATPADAEKPQDKIPRFRKSYG